MILSLTACLNPVFRVVGTKLDRINEEQLIKRSVSGDKDAFRVLVEKYQGRALSIAIGVLRNREDAEDVVQESFVKAYLSLKSFEGKSSFYTWVYKIVYNMAIDYRRKVSRRKTDTQFEEDVALVLEETAPAGPQDVFLRKERIDIINKALSGLSEEHRAVIVLREIEGMSYDEIADIIGVNKGTVMSRLHYARKNLQEALENGKLVDYSGGSVRQSSIEGPEEAIPPLVKGNQ